MTNSSHGKPWPIEIDGLPVLKNGWKMVIYPLKMVIFHGKWPIYRWFTVLKKFRLGPSKKHGYVSHNQMVLGGGHPVIRCEGHYGNHNRMGKKNSLSGNGLMTFPQYG